MDDRFWQIDEDVVRVEFNSDSLEELTRTPKSSKYTVREVRRIENPRSPVLEVPPPIAEKPLAAKSFLDFATMVPPCNECGGKLVFDPHRQGLVCRHCCRSILLRAEADTQGLPYAEMRREAPETALLLCSACGMMIFSQDGATCPVCGSAPQQVQLNSVSPTHLLPYHIDADDALELALDWAAQSALPVPKLKEQLQANLQALYMPRWLFDAASESHYASLGGSTKMGTVQRLVDVGGKKKLRTYNETFEDWQPLSGVFRSEHRLVAVSAGSLAVLPHTLLALDAVDSFDMTQTLPVNPAYLAGALVAAATLTARDGWRVARKQMEEVVLQGIEAEVRERTGCERVKDTLFNSEYSDILVRQVLLPLWIGWAELEGRRVLVLVNGQNGAFYGEVK
ncbi:MAG: hypothetical protein IJC70_05990 [Firmicutes bacterium]|nr:hypothetical protein [Bacillota bacterium]